MQANAAETWNGVDLGLWYVLRLSLAWERAGLVAGNEMSLLCEVYEQGREGLWRLEVG